MPGKSRKKPAPQKLTKSQANITRALKDLALDVPYYTCRLVGNRLEFRLYGGQVVYWPEEEDPVGAGSPCPDEAEKPE